MNPEALPQSEPQQEPKTPQPSPEETYQRIATARQQQWDKEVANERLRIARKRGLINKESTQKEIEDILWLITLPGDEMEYARDKKGNLRLARDKFGFLSFPKTHGRRRPHMTKHHLGLKSLSISIFRKIFEPYRDKLEAEAKAAGKEFQGVPVSDITKLGAKAATLAVKRLKALGADERRRARNQQRLSRRINWRIVPGNTNRQRYGA